MILCYKNKLLFYFIKANRKQIENETNWDKEKMRQTKNANFDHKISLSVKVWFHRFFSFLSVL